MVQKASVRYKDLRGCSLASAVLLGSNHLARTVRDGKIGRRWSAGRLDVAVGAVGVQHCLGAGVASVAVGLGVGGGIDAVGKNTCQSL